MSLYVLGCMWLSPISKNNTVRKKTLVEKLWWIWRINSNSPKCFLPKIFWLLSILSHDLPLSGMGWDQSAMLFKVKAWNVLLNVSFTDAHCSVILRGYCTSYPVLIAFTCYLRECLSLTWWCAAILLKDLHWFLLVLYAFLIVPYLYLIDLLMRAVVCVAKLPRSICQSFYRQSFLSYGNSLSILWTLC